MSGNDIGFDINDRNTGKHACFIVIKNAKNSKVFTRKKIAITDKKGHIDVHNVPLGKYIFYTEVVRKGSTMRSSERKFTVQENNTPTPVSTATVIPTLFPTETITPTATPTSTATPTPTETPTPTATPPIAELASGLGTNCARFYSGALRCWGQNTNGKLGYGNTTNIGDNETPASAGDVSVGFSVAQVAVGGSHICAVSGAGTKECWGTATNGQLGYSNVNHIGDNEFPSSVGTVDVGNRIAVQVTAGLLHTCALFTNGAVMCWGPGTDGRLGYSNTNTIGDTETPNSVGEVNLGGAQAAQLVAGNAHTCALLTNGSVMCWGDGASGQLGYGNTNDIGDNETPIAAGSVNLGGATVVQLAAGATHTCALTSTGSVFCWGAASGGPLGYGNLTNIGDNETPASAGPVDLGVVTPVEIVAGSLHTCVRLNTGSVKCWGTSSSGQLGYGNTTTIGDNETPATVGVVSIGATASQISSGLGISNCVLLSDGAVRCWGSGANGRLGYGNLNDIGDNENPDTAGDVQVIN